MILIETGNLIEESRSRALNTLLRRSAKKLVANINEADFNLIIIIPMTIDR